MPKHTPKLSAKESNKSYSQALWGKEKMKNHTPTPWRKGSTYYNVIDESGFNIADCTGMDRTVSERKANAEFIVRACNSHDELVEALKKTHEMIIKDGLTVNPLARGLINIIEESLAKAGAK